MGITSIEWCDYTFNPWWGCVKVSPGCAHCYAETLSNRYQHDVWGKGKPHRELSEHNWSKPLTWERQAIKQNTRLKVFCASMADVFEVSDNEETNIMMHKATNRLWKIIESTPHLDWLLLTKRPENVRGMVPYQCLYIKQWPKNVWIGTSVENQHFADIRIPQLHDIPAPIRFLSCEPLLGPIDLSQFTRISWIIAGAESGHKARPMSEEWVRSLKNQCVERNIPFFYKQNAVNGKKLPLPVLDGQQWAEMPKI